MIHRFLRLFRVFRAIESERQVLAADLERERQALAAEAKQREAAVTEADFWRARSEEWEARYIAANTGAILARETVADFMSQLRFGRKIFEHAPALPERPPEERKPLPKQRVQARYLVKQGEAQFERDYTNYVREQQRKILAERDAQQAPSVEPEPEPAPVEATS